MGSHRVEHFAGRLKELRELAGLTQQQLGDRAGLHKLSVAKLEQGIREPTWATVAALADALGVGCQAFMEPATARPAQGPGRPPRAKEADPLPKRPRGRPPKATPGTPPAGELEAEGKRLHKSAPSTGSAEKKRSGSRKGKQP